MAIIEHDLLPKQKLQKRNLKVKVDLYPYATELYDELLAMGLIERLKMTPQLGVIKVPKKLMKSRYDYAVLQLYFHQIIKKELQSKLELTYNNPIRSSEFSPDFQYLTTSKTPTIADMLQLLTFVYNLGHFHNTFTSSRAVVLASDVNPVFYDKVVFSSANPEFQEISKKLLDDHNYQSLHLLNSLLVLERCNPSLQSVQLAQKLIYSYLNLSNIPEKSKLHYVFKIFKTVRNASYISYDLQISKMPITIDLCNIDSLVILFQELLAIYNDQLPATNLFNSIGKLLDDTVYNENADALCYYRISRKIANTLIKDNELNSKDYYKDLWLSPDSILNKKHLQNRDYSSNAILKLTFSYCDRVLSKELLIALERLENTRVGYYDRYTGERTLLVSIKNKCTSKHVVAFRVLKTVVSYLRRVSSPSISDTRFLLATKFFLYYFFDENPIIIKPTVDSDKCVLCTRGKKQRSAAVKTILANEYGDKDDRHEVEFLHSRLLNDENNDTSVLVPASILVFMKNTPAKSLCEFDGLIIHPMRKQSQIILLESKNTNETPSFAKKCLSDKLKKLNIPFTPDNIETVGFDAFLEITL